MKFELRAFRDDQVSAVHIEEVDVDNPYDTANELAFRFGLGQPVFPVASGFRYSDGYVYIYPLEKVQAP